ncbi:hypothetical protein H920_07452 [Fukomys damarensis]|uniref:Uncharacterized protein n=1 Tax=Fukomys damarensis TaxID=885580 RepID=A0A091DL16_FUKDA|nr:hypothetical protein H920_07452 [Fukomys damarensis]
MGSVQRSRLTLTRSPVGSFVLLCAQSRQHWPGPRCSGRPLGEAAGSCCGQWRLTVTCKLEMSPWRGQLHTVPRCSLSPVPSAQGEAAAVWGKSSPLHAELTRSPAFWEGPQARKTPVQAFRLSCRVAVSRQVATLLEPVTDTGDCHEGPAQCKEGQCRIS